MSSILMKGIVRGGRVEVAEPIDLPDGSEVTIAGNRNATSIRADDWTESKNERRCNLIRKKFAQGIDEPESRELADLQEQVAAYRQRMTPLPYDVLDELRAALQAPSASTT